MDLLIHLSVLKLSVAQSTRIQNNLRKHHFLKKTDRVFIGKPSQSACKGTSASMIMMEEQFLVFIVKLLGL